MNYFLVSTRITAGVRFSESLCYNFVSPHPGTAHKPTLVYELKILCILAIPPQLIMISVTSTWLDRKIPKRGNHPHNLIDKPSGCLLYPTVMSPVNQLITLTRNVSRHISSSSPTSVVLWLQ